MPIPYNFNPTGRPRSVSGSSGMYFDGTALKGVLCNPHSATAVDNGADGRSLTNGNFMFYQCQYLNSCKLELPNLTDGHNMFACSGLTSWTVDLPNLTFGTYMFYVCASLKTFSGDMPNLTNGSYMFQSCGSLTSFSGDLSSLTNGYNMFNWCTSLTTFSVDMPNLTNGPSMFNNCTSLTSFAGNLSKLAGKSTYEGGYNMFYNCTSLKTFNSTLPALAYGQNMFYGCILDEASVLRILNSIPTWTSGTHQLHLGKNTNYKDSADIAALLGTTTPIAARTNYSYKGWTITVTT